jgi:hypothetical protein
VKNPTALELTDITWMDQRCFRDLGINDLID